MLLHSLYFEPLLFKNSLKQMEKIKQVFPSSENRWQCFQALEVRGRLFHDQEAEEVG